MLNIPSQVKELLLKDSVNKNFRVHFPNGEFRDLTNSDVESESVKFTERISSGAGIKFGLCEASVLEFVCYGVPNIKGAKIEAQIEVDVSSCELYKDSRYQSSGTIALAQNASIRPNGDTTLRLTFIKTARADMTFPYTINGESYVITSDESEYSKTVIERRIDLQKDDRFVYERNTGENFTRANYSYIITTKVKTFAWVQDDKNPFPYYPIKYGTFYVDSCKKDAGVLKRRDVEAYSLPMTNDYFKQSDFEKKKASLLNKYEYDIPKLLIANNVIGIDGMDKEIVSTGDLATITQNIYVGSGTSTYIIVEVKGKQKIFNASDGLANEIYTADGLTDSDDVLINETIDTFLDGLESQGVFFPLGRDTIGRYVYNNCRPFCKFLNAYKIPLSDAENIIYPYYRSTSAQVSIFVPAQISLSYSRSYSEITSITLSDYNIKKVDTSSLPSFMVTDDKPSEINLRELAEGYFELSGKMGVFTRNGGIELRQLPKLSDIRGDKLMPSMTLYPSNTLLPTDAGKIESDLNASTYSECWIDEVDSLGYDRVSITYDTETESQKYKYKDLVDVDAEDYNPSNYQSYTLGRNEIVQSTKLTDETAQAIIDEVGEAIKGVQYIPYECDCVGMPWLEAGDPIVIVTKDGTYKSYILSRKLEGIQYLRDSFEAR